MANTPFLAGIDAFLQGRVKWTAAAGSTIKCVAIDAAQYTPNFLTHTSLENVPAQARYGTPQTLTLIDATNGLCDAADFTISGISAGAPTLEALLFYLDTGNPATSTLLSWQGTSSDTSLPIGANANALAVTLPAAGVLSFEVA